MGCSFGGEGPSILQLHQWGPTQFPLNLSEFREAYISPRRELLLLLSYQCEALLFPLITGDSMHCNNREDFQNPSSFVSHSAAWTEFSRLDSRKNKPYFSGSLPTVPDYDFPHESKSPSSSNFPSIFDVNSLAWGVSGDIYNQHKDTAFRELLFVSGKHGVTVHAFCQSDKSTEVIESSLDGQFEEGLWVEWGPSATLAPTMEVQEHSSLRGDFPGNVLDVDRIDKATDCRHKFCGEDGDDILIRNSRSKKWLQTFLTKVETMEYDGNVRTRFPDKQSFPCSARVVSFGIFDSNLLNFVSSSFSVSNKEGTCKEAVPNLLTNMLPSSASSSSNRQAEHISSNPLDAGMSSPYECSKVFSSYSHHLVGFVLTLVDCVTVNSSDLSGRSLNKFFIVVARIESWGIQWLCSVKLEGSLNMDVVFEWTDFQFSEDFLVCLKASGSIFFYRTITGEYVAHLDILQICGLCPLSKLHEPEQSFVEGDLAPKSSHIKSHRVDEIHAKATHQTGNFPGERIFRRLIVASGTSLLAAVDEYGVVYVICASDHIPEKYYSFQKLLPHYQHSGLGVVVGLEVAGSDIGHQRVLSNHFGSHYSKFSSIRNESLLSHDYSGSTEPQKMLEQNHFEKVGQYDLHWNGICAAPHKMDKRSLSCDLPSYFMRKIYLPSDRFSEDDFICFSPTGISRLIKKQNLMGKKSFQIRHSHLHVNLAIHDDGCLNSGFDLCNLQGRKETFEGEAIGCAFQGYFYLVTRHGLSVVLPSVSVSPDFLPVETIGYRQAKISPGSVQQVGEIFEKKQLEERCSPWKVEVLDKVLLYEGPEVADSLCMENGWDLKVSRMRRLQLALDYLKFDEIEQSLEMLVGIDLAEEGILRLLFAATYLMFHKVGNDSEVSAASRLLTLASCFATKMIRTYGLVLHKKAAFTLQFIKGDQTRSSDLPDKEENEMEISRKLREMAHFLEIIRNLQSRLSVKFKRPGQELVNDGKVWSLMDLNPPQEDSHLAILSADAMSLETGNRHDSYLPASAMDIDDTEKLALMPIESLDNSLPDNFSQVSALVSGGELEKNALPLENPKDMIARWEMNNLDFKAIVKDALLSGRLPLAVLQLHLHRLKDLVNDDEYPDTFTEVRDVGRAIAYDLFLKGEIGLAIATLQRLGEDIETNLKQLVFGSVRRSLRVKITDEMKRYGYLGQYEWNILERISVIERLYPSSSFWRTFLACQKEFMVVSSSLASPTVINLCVSFNDHFIECGEVDGVVLGTWTNFNAVPAINDDDDDVNGGYWVAAAIWSDAWDQRTFDRIVLDQPSVIGVHLLWESQLEYHICHNNWEEVSKLLDMIPISLLSDGSLQIGLDGLRSAFADGSSREHPDHGNYICSVEDLDVVYMDIPNIRIFKIPVHDMSSSWLRVLLEDELAKKFIFLKEYWEGTAEIICLLSRSGFITGQCKNLYVDEAIGSSSDLKSSYTDGEYREDTIHALHKLLVHHCVVYNLPNLLDLYLDNCKLILDDLSLCLLQEAAGDCQWAKWLLLSRIKGHEYDSSFSNSRSIMSRNLIHGNNLSVPEIDEIIRTVDDIAEGGDEMAALATLMYAPFPIQNCLSSGSINRHSNTSAQCTLENLRPILQRFPTLWRTLVAASFGQDTICNYLGPKAKHVIGNSALSDYLNWRDSIFLSTGRDTSLLQMLPCWFPKAVRRLVQLYVQGPLGWQSLTGLPIEESFLDHGIDFIINANENTEIGAVSWEAAIQKRVEEELYSSSLKETVLGIEHQLHRGRPLAAFNHLLGIRVQKLKSDKKYNGQSNTSAPGQTNVQSDVQTFLAPLAQNEEFLISSVMPLAIMHFEDSMLVASCAFLLELCGLSASILRVDIATLRRISSFYKSTQRNEHHSRLLLKGSAFHAVSQEGDIADSLAQALADDYLHRDCANIVKEEGSPKLLNGKQSLQALMLVLQHLEKASLPKMDEGKTCGSWLFTGSGDGAELRSKQKAASQHWKLVTTFCQMHQIPLSTKYLAALARDNDWVGFLSEAQIGGYTFDTVLQVASKEFGDPRLKIHIVTVLKGMQSRKKPILSSNLDTLDKRSESLFSDENLFIPAELFGILAQCEKQNKPGEALLREAKNLCWSILALVASCFSDVSPLSCLTVWLEITAARETSSIKVNDTASLISKNVGAAVEVTNSISAASRAIRFHYNRRNPKRRRLMESMSVDPLVASASDVSVVSSGGRVFPVHGIISEQEGEKIVVEHITDSSDSDDGPASLSKMVAVLCEQQLFLPLLRAFEMFLPSCFLLPFIRALQAFSQMRLSEASAHLGSFSARIREEPMHLQTNIGREGHIGMSWISSTSVKAADAMLSTCPSPYEKRCLLRLLAATDFGDGGSVATRYRRLYWKINLAEPSLPKDNGLHLGNETLDDASLLTALEKNGHWEHARNWARHLETSGAPWKSAVHHVTETQAESMVAEWKEFLWDVPEERVALWSHCQRLFIRHSFPALQAGLFFLKHAEAVEKDLPARELHELLLLSLQWLSGIITQSTPVYPLHLLREIEPRVWLLAVESEAQVKSEGDFTLTSSRQDPLIGNSSNIIDRTASVVTKMDNHINAMRSKTVEKNDPRENNQTHHKNPQINDTSFYATAGGYIKTKRRAKNYLPSRRLLDLVDKTTDSEDGSSPPYLKNDIQTPDENFKIEVSFSKWEEKVGPAELERAVLSLMEFGQITAAKQLQNKLSPSNAPSEFTLVDVALKLASLSTPSSEVSLSMLDAEVKAVMQSYNILADQHFVQPLQVLESLATIFTEGSGRGLCKRIIAVVKAANVLGVSFSEAFIKQPIEVLQLLSLKAQDTFEEAKLLVQTHSMSASSIAQILAESFLKGLLAAHRGGYMDSQKEEGPAPLLWRFSDFLKWAELCPSEPEIGHALMRLVITGQEIPHACEVELLILSHHFYKSSACLDGVDVLVSLAATRVEAYVPEGDFQCLARLITGVGNFHALNFILGILIENGQLDLLLQKFSAAADTNTGTAEAVRGFRMAVLTSLKHFNPNDLDAFAMVYNHFDMRHETAALLESRAKHSSQQWFRRYDKDQNEDLLESMRYYIEAAEVHSSIDAGNKTRSACAQASLLSLQIRMPDIQWLNLSETNARRALVEQSRFQEALIVAEAYGLNQPSEWALVLWNQMLKPELTEQFVAEFVAVLPLHPSMLADLAKFYRAEVAARGDQSQFSVWLTGGGLPAEWAKYLGRSFRCLLKRTRDLRLQLQLATVATGFTDIIDACLKASDKVPDAAGPLVLRKGHGGAYLPLM